MPNNKPKRSKRNGHNARSRQQVNTSCRQKAGAANESHGVRLRPERRQQVDHSTIALCYWLLAQRIVKEAEDNGDLTCPDPESHEGEAGDQS